MAAQRVVTDVTINGNKATIAFGAGLAEHLLAPFTLVRHEPIGDDRWAIVVSSSSGMRAYLVTDDALRALDRWPRTQRGDPLLTDSKVEFMIEAIGSASRGDTEAAGQSKALPAPPPGSLSTDGTFLTLEIDGARTHFVIARDALPQLQGAPVLGPDGSQSVTMRLPDRSTVRFMVVAGRTIELEKAISILRSYGPAAAPLAEQHATAASPGTPHQARPLPTVAVRTHPNGTSILVMGILGLVVCGPLAIVAWVMGNAAQGEMDSQRNVTWTNRSNVNAGRACGIIGTCLWVLIALGSVLVIGGAGS